MIKKMYVLIVILVGTKMNINKTYKIDRKNMFFTFPRSEISTESLINGLLTYDRFISNIDCIIIGAEEHKDGSPHLHCLIMCKGTVSIQIIDLKKHLNIKHFNDAGRIRRMKDTLKYVCKDGHVTTFPTNLNWKGMLKNAEQKKSLKTDMVLDKLKEVPHDTDIDDFLTDLGETELGGFVAFHTKPISDYFKIYHGTMKKRSHVAPSLPSEITSWILGQNHPTVDIWSWLSTVLKKEMKLGDKHLYIWGPTMSGKSSLINYLKEIGWNLYFIPKGEDFFDGIKDEKWDLAIADEVRGKDQTIQFWNSWCDKFMPLKQKGKQSYLKSRIIPTILLSNYSPTGLFAKVAKDNPDILAAFERRWNIIPVGPSYGLIDLPNKLV